MTTTTVSREQPELTFRDVFAFLRRGLVAALVGAAAAATVAFVLSERTAPTFEARSSLLVAPPNQDVRSLLGTVVTASAIDGGVYASAATTHGVLAEALRQTGLEPTTADVERLALRTLVTFDEGRVSSVLHVDVVANDPWIAAAEANAIAAALTAWDQRRAAVSIDRAVMSLEEQLATFDLEIARLQADPETPAGDVDSLVAVRNTQREQLLLARARIAGTAGTLSAFQEAVGPAPQVGPRSRRNAAVAAISAIIATYAYLLVATAFDTRVRSLEDLARLVGSPVLAGFGRRSRREPRFSGESAAYLAVKLLIEAPAVRPLVLMITAVESDVDTIPLSVALAESFARDGKATLLVASDLRNPLPKVGFDQPFGRASFTEPPLDQMLSQPERDWRPNTVLFSRHIAFDVVCAYEPVDNASNVLARGFARLMHRLQDGYEVIVVDASPVLAAPDAMTIAPHMAGVVLVTRLPGLQRRTVQDAVNAFGPFRSSITGVVAVDVPGGETRLRSTGSLDVRGTMVDETPPGPARPARPARRDAASRR